MLAPECVVQPHRPEHKNSFQPDRPDPLAALDSIAVISRSDRGQEIRHQADCGEQWNRIVCGAARRCALRRDGRRQITDFLLPDDFFVSFRDDENFVVEAVVNGTVVASYPRQSLERLVDAYPQVGSEIRDMMLRAACRLEGQILILGRVTATGKVSSFLLEMARRLPDVPPDRVDLLMSRYDIADYLAISVETVSRALTQLRQRKAIALGGTRRIKILNANALAEPDSHIGLAV